MATQNGGKDSKDSGSSSDKSSSAPADNSAAGNSTEPAKAEEAVLEVSAGDLISAYEANELAADQQYKNKLLKVKGTFNSATEVLGHKAVSVTKNEDFSVYSVSCSLVDDAEVNKATQLKKNQTITVQGENSGFNGFSVSLKQCTIVQ